MAPPGALQKSFNVAQRDIADKDCARMFYASGLPFNLARSPYFRKYSQSLANSSLMGYTPPSYDRLRTTLLSREKAHVNRPLQPIRDTWNKKGVSLLSDGWSDRQRRPLINVMASSAGGAMFVKAIDSSGIVKDGEYVASLFIKAIKEVGEANVVQIVTDNASNYKAAGLSIENKYPHIFWTPCVVHSLNLALKSVCTPPDKSAQYDQSETRFASNIIMTLRLREVKTSLEKMVMDANWKIYREDGNSVAEIKACEASRHRLSCFTSDGSNGIPRISLDGDHEVSMNRSKCLKRLFPNQPDLRKVYAEYGAFSSGSDYFNWPHVIDARMFEEPLSWWANHGASAPLLQALAFKLLVQPASSSCSERNWSTYSLIQSIKRNRLATSRAEDLVFVHCNLHLLSRKSKEYKEGPTKYWDICGDLFDIEGHDIMELAQISLDDPEMQTMTFDDDNESQQVVED
ncbi:hypothetical protein CsSME_00012201 [Camellia sinensis var. sinensis]